MKSRINELIQHTKEKLGLQDYYLYRSDVRRSATILGDTVYTLSMEWFPNHEQDLLDEDLNPTGTAVVEVDFHTGQFTSVIFVSGISYAEGVKLSIEDSNAGVRWIESETGLQEGTHFVFHKRKDKRMSFRKILNGVSVSPSGLIEVEVDEAGNLTFFSINGDFSKKEPFNREKYELTLPQVKHIVAEQLKLAEFPNMKTEKMTPAYAIEEVYIRNRDLSLIPFQLVEDEKSHVDVHKVIEWSHAIDKAFQRKEINATESLSQNQIENQEPHPDLRKITEKEIKNSVVAVQQFLAQVYSSDSGKWVLQSLSRSEGYLLAKLQAKHEAERVFKRQLKLFIHSNTYEVLNYMDNKSFIDLYLAFRAADKVTITKQEALKRLRDFMILTPYYVYDRKQGRYVLCGKLDCHYAVNAITGEVVSLDNL
ncbi:hypothetical protein [Priestia flexa]|uniref:hypothetical protein n=1 Tax=Priestia flexa TaxID=86664 RepID=UPI001C95CA41|nr:hypothetical protein [Priestia flexa]MBY6087349.1 hypothetical protein [Priestia flexa]